jgi:hypothetical protein
MTDDLVNRLRHVFDDTYEVAEWIDDSTYEGAELFTHVVGMFKTMLAAAIRIERLEAALREIIERAEYRMSHSVSDDTCLIARKALEGKDD